MKTHIHLGNMVDLDGVVFSIGMFLKKNRDNPKIGNQLVLYDELAFDDGTNRLCRAIHTGLMRYSTAIEPLIIDKHNNKHFRAYYEKICSTIYFNTIPLHNQEPIFENVKCVHLFTNYPTMFDHSSIDFSNVREIHFHLCRNQLENETIRFLEKFCNGFEKPVFTYYYYQPKIFQKEWCDGCKAICQKCEYKSQNSKQQKIAEKYSCIMQQRMIEPGQTVTPFDIETDYPVCSMLTRQSNNEMRLMVYDNCPYYVEHYMEWLKEKNNANAHRATK